MLLVLQTLIKVRLTLSHRQKMTYYGILLVNPLSQSLCLRHVIFKHVSVTDSATNQIINS